MSLTNEIKQRLKDVDINIEIISSKGKSIVFTVSDSLSKAKLLSVFKSSLTIDGDTFKHKNKREFINEIKEYINHLLANNNRMYTNEVVKTDIGDIEIEIDKSVLEDKENKVIEFDLNMISYDDNDILKACKAFCNDVNSDYIDYKNNIELSLVDKNEVFVLVDNVVFYIKCSKRCLKSKLCYVELFNKIIDEIELHNFLELDEGI
jgi:hypothetical protein